MEDQADLHELLDGADEEMDFEPEDEAATPAASAQRRKALRPASTAAKPARGPSPQRRHQAAADPARAKDPISWSASMGGSSGSGNGNCGGGSQHRASDCNAKKPDPSAKQPKNAVVGFLRQRLSRATEAVPAEPPKKLAIKSQLADKTKAVPAKSKDAGRDDAGGETLSKTARRRQERKHAQKRKLGGEDAAKERTVKRQASAAAVQEHRSRSHSNPIERLRRPPPHEPRPVHPMHVPLRSLGRNHSAPLGPPDFRGPEPSPRPPHSTEREFGRRGSGLPPPPQRGHGGPRFEHGWDGGPPPGRFGPGPWDAPPPFADRPPPPFGGFFDDRPPPARGRSPPPGAHHRHRSPSPPPPLPHRVPPPPPPHRVPGPPLALSGRPKLSPEAENERRGCGVAAGYSPPRKRGEAPPSPPHVGLRLQHSGRPAPAAPVGSAAAELLRAPRARSPERRRAASPDRRRVSRADRQKPEAARAGSGGSRKQRDGPDRKETAHDKPHNKATAPSGRAGEVGRRSDAGKAAAATAAAGDASANGAAKDATSAKKLTAAVPKAAAPSPATQNSATQRPGGRAEKPQKVPGPAENGSSGIAHAAPPATTAAKPGGKAAADPAASAEKSSRFTYDTPASEEKLWFYRDTKGVVQGPHSVKEYRSWLQGLERLSTLKPEMARELDEFSSMLLWKEGNSNRVPILKVVS